jgi:hypothetical protein
MLQLLISGLCLRRFRRCDFRTLKQPLRLRCVETCCWTCWICNICLPCRRTRAFICSVGATFSVVPLCVICACRVCASASCSFALFLKSLLMFVVCRLAVPFAAAMHQRFLFGAGLQLLISDLCWTKFFLSPCFKNGWIWCCWSELELWKLEGSLPICKQGRLLTGLSTAAAERLSKGRQQRKLTTIGKAAGLSMAICVLQGYFINRWRCQGMTL